MILAHEAGSGIEPQSHEHEGRIQPLQCAVLLSLGIWETRYIECVFHLGYFQDCGGFILEYSPTITLV